MIISTTVRRLGLCVFLLLCMAIISTSKQQANREDECYYYYIQQPSSNVSCNPWPYIESYSGNTLVLHCDLLSPQNNDIPNVEWYRVLYNDDSSEPRRIHYGGRKRKFSTPTSSGDISSGFKRINFTLFVNDVNEADAGCYWCEIRASARKCSFHMKPSSEFCLHKASAYEDRENCPILPVNSSVVCAADTVCNELPANWLGDPYLIINDITMSSGGPTQVPSSLQPMVPAHIPSEVLMNVQVGTVSSAYGSNSITSSSSPLHTRQRPPKTFMTHSIQPTTSSNYYQNISVTSETSLTSASISSMISLTGHIPHQNSSAADYYRTKIVNILPSSSIHTSKSVDNKQATVVSSSSVTIAGSGTQSNSTKEKELPLHLTLVQISVFIGIGACTVLFAVISVLVFGVVMLCRKTTPTTPARTNHMQHEGHHILSNSPAELISTVWRRELETSPVPMSIVNTEHSLLPPNSAPSYSSIRVAVTNEDDRNQSHHTQDQQQTSTMTVTSPMTSVPMPTLPFHMNDEFRWRAYSLPLLTERSHTINRANQPRQNMHHLLLEGNRESRLDYQEIDMNNVASVSSPELHYYHVLERPEYYNCIWLEGEDGHELLLGQAKRSNRQRITIKEDDSESDSEYHWRVVLTSSGGQEGGQDLDRSISSKRVGRHLYRRLDHSTMEKFQDYAKVSIASSNHDSDGSHTHSQ